MANIFRIRRCSSMVRPIPLPRPHNRGSACKTGRWSDWQKCRRFRSVIEVCCAACVRLWHTSEVFGSAAIPSTWNSPSLCSHSQSFPALHTGLGGAAADPSRPHACPTRRARGRPDGLPRGAHRRRPSLRPSRMRSKRDRFVYSEPSRGRCTRTLSTLPVDRRTCRRFVRRPSQTTAEPQR